MPTRYPGGVTNVAEYETLGQYLLPDPTRCNVWFDDFHKYTAGDWTVTESNAAATQAMTAGEGGLLLITNSSAAASDECSLVWTTSTFTFNRQKQSWMKARFKVSNAGAGVAIGCFASDTTPIASAPTGGLLFYKAGSNGAGPLTFRQTLSSTTTSTTLANLADDTYVTVGWWYHPVLGLSIYSGDRVVGKQVTTNYPHNVACVVGFSVANDGTNTTARTMTLDYLMVAQER